jgi:FkbM family methyltransferase
MQSFLTYVFSEVNRGFEVSREQGGHALELISRCEGDVFDVGANEGQWASMALEVTSNRQLHCFEPVRSNFETLRQNLSLQSNVVLNHFGLGEETKSIEFNFYPDSPTRSTAFFVEDRQTGDAKCTSSRIPW